MNCMPHRSCQNPARKPKHTALTYKQPSYTIIPATANIICIHASYQYVTYIIAYYTRILLNIDSRTRGHTLKLKKGRVATDLIHHFFTERIVNTWNHLDASVVEAETLNTFKSRLQRMYDNDESFLGRTTSY